ncbi:ATP-binding cassette domain-containing protein [Nocardia zapadnayensis]|nr:ATP-binding cassette domain-containing protein [Nocardia zapadnayensis]
MIRMLLRVLGPEYARPVRRTVALMTVTAVAEGLSYALLVPVLRALFGSTPADARPWLIAFAVTVVFYGVLRYLSDLRGFRVGTALLLGLYHRLGDHLARLPLGWYGTGRVGHVSVPAGRGVLDAMGVIAHLLAPFVSAWVTPLTIVAVMPAFDWRMGLAALAAAPVVAVIQLRAGRAAAATDEERHRRDQEATARVVEYLQAQPVLRAGGRGGERFGLLDDALRGIERASRRSTLAALGRPDATAAEVRAAAEAARLDEVIERLPGGWSAAVGEGGGLLSGGERQRVSIARALLKDAPIVLLDEVTSALDPVNEAAVHEGIERLVAGRTVVMVAHRLNTVRRADRIVFLGKGRIVEEGTHEELLRRDGRCADFWAVSDRVAGE